VAGIELAEIASVPMIMAAVIPLVPTDQFPMMGFPGLPIPGFKRLTYSMAEIAVWGLFRNEINSWRQEDLELPVISRKNYFQSDLQVINGFSPRVVERPPEWGENVHITGYWFQEDPEWQPSSDLEEFLEDGPLPVFIGFGSMPIKDPGQTTSIILDALKQTNQRGVLGAGWAGLGDAELPETVFALEYAPYGWLLDWGRVYCWSRSCFPE
jgi:sterol 3beta-glucosyltransferase